MSELQALDLIQRVIDGVMSENQCLAYLEAAKIHGAFSPTLKGLGLAYTGYDYENQRWISTDISS